MIYKLSANPMKIQNGCFVEIDKLTLKIVDYHSRYNKYVIHWFQSRVILPPSPQGHSAMSGDSWWS